MVLYLYCGAAGAHFSQLHLICCDLMDSSLPGSSDRGIFPARTLEMVAISNCRESSGPRDRSFVS